MAVEVKRRLLIVDDEVDLVEVLQEIMEQRGFETVGAYDGEEALEIIKTKGNFDVLLTDLNMPKMNGIELIKQCADVDPFMVPVLITGYADTRAAIAALKARAYDFISKPFKLETIDLTIKRSLENHDFLVSKHNYQKKLESDVEERTVELHEINSKILNLYRLAQKTKEILELEPKLGYFKDFCFDVFRPDNMAFLLFDPDRNIFLTSEFYSRKNEVLKNNYKIKDILPFENGKYSYKLSLFKSDVEHISIKLERKNFFGILYLGFNSERNFDTDDKLFELFISEIEGTLYASNMINEHQGEMKKMFVSSVKAHAYTIEAKDPYTKGHCDRVEIFSRIIAEKMIDDKDRIFALSIACILHDIGKIGVSETIINKPGKLNDDEYAEMKKHPVVGAEIVQHLYGMNLAPIVKYHHEWYNGKGYPDGIKGEQIPLEARIMSVADTYDAMTSSRPYRNGLPPEVAYEEILRFSNIQFDPEVVKVFIDVFDEFKKVDPSRTGIEIEI